MYNTYCKLFLTFLCFVSQFKTIFEDLFISLGLFDVSELVNVLLRFIADEDVFRKSYDFCFIVLSLRYLSK